MESALVSRINFNSDRPEMTLSLPYCQNIHSDALSNLVSRMSSYNLNGVLKDAPNILISFLLEEVQNHSLNLDKGFSIDINKLNSESIIQTDACSLQTDEMNLSNTPHVSCLKLTAKRSVPKPKVFQMKSNDILFRREILEAKESDSSELTCTSGRQEEANEISLCSNTMEVNISGISCLENCSIGPEMMDLSNNFSLMKAVDYDETFLPFNELENIQSKKCVTEKIHSHLEYGK